MIKLLIVSTYLLYVAVSQEPVQCSGYIKIAKQDAPYIKLKDIVVTLVEEDTNLIIDIDVHSNGFYALEIEHLQNYHLRLQSKVDGFQVLPGSHSFNFKHRSYEEATQSCLQQINFKVSPAQPKESPKAQEAKEQQKVELDKAKEEIEQQPELEEQLKGEQTQPGAPQQQSEQEEPASSESVDSSEQFIGDSQEAYRVAGVISFSGEQFTANVQKLHTIKSFQVVNAEDEQVRGRLLAFNRYFEFESNQRTELRVKVVVEKEKETGEQTNKRYVFEEKVAKESLKPGKTRKVDLVIKGTQEQKEQFRLTQVITPLVIFLLVVFILNYEKFLKRV